MIQVLIKSLINTPYHLKQPQKRKAGQIDRPFFLKYLLD